MSSQRLEQALHEIKRGERNADHGHHSYVVDAQTAVPGRVVTAARARGGSNALLLDAFEDAPDTRESMEEIGGCDLHAAHAFLPPNYLQNLGPLPAVLSWANGVRVRVRVNDVACDAIGNVVKALLTDGLAIDKAVHLHAPPNLRCHVT